jgi:hypothetical protein
LHIEEVEDQNVSPWCKTVRRFLAQSLNEQPEEFVQEIKSEFCISCQHKQSSDLIISTSQGMPKDVGSEEESSTPQETKKK